MGLVSQDDQVTHGTFLVYILRKIYHFFSQIASIWDRILNRQVPGEDRDQFLLLDRPMDQQMTEGEGGVD